MIRKRLVRMGVVLFATLGLGSCDSGPAGPSAGGVASVQVSPGAPRLEIGTTQQLSAVVIGAGGDTLRGKTVVWASEDPAVAEVSPTGMVRGLIPGSTRIAASAEGRDGFAMVTITPVAVAAVAVSPARSEVAVRDTVRLQATATDAAGGVLTGRTVSWESRDPSVATVDASGLVTGVKLGTVTVVATSEGKSGSAEVVVTAGTPASGAKVGGAGGSGVAGQPLPDSLALRVINSAGEPVSGVEVTWSVTSGGGSISPGTSLTNADGVAQAQWTLGNQPGEQTVAAQVAGLPPVVFTVQATAPPPPPSVPVATVTVTPREAQIAIGQTVDLDATARDAAGNALTGRSLSWKSSNEAVASVDGTGGVTGKVPGKVTVTATVEGQIGTAEVTVLAPPPPTVASVTVEPGSATLTSLGATRQFTATVRDANRNPIPGVQVAWTSSKNEFAEVNSSGLATAVGNGTTTITAAVGSVRGTATLTVDQRVATVAVAPTSATLTEGDTEDFDAAAFDANGRRAAGAEFRWSSSNTGVATVNSSGVATARQPGTASITASSEGQSGTAQVRVTARPPASVATVTVTPREAQVAIGQTVDLDATAYDAAGNALTGRSLSWTSGNEAIASVDDRGGVTGRVPGKVTITATVEGKIGTAEITVLAPPPPTVSRIVVEPGSATLVSLGDTRQFTATARDANGNVVPGVTVGWSSSRDGVAEVNSDGLATAVGNGTTTITASAGGVSGTATLNVDQRVTRVAVIPESATLTEGDTKDFDAAAYDANGRRVAAVEFRWDSSEDRVAVVDPSSGLVTARQAGRVNIVAASEGVTGKAEVSVTAPAPTPVASVGVSPSSGEIEVGETRQLTATPRDAAAQPLNRDVEWSSSNSDVATVSQTGLVRGVAPGSVEIRARSEGKTGTADFTVLAPPPTPVASVEVTPESSTLNVGGTKQLTATPRDASGNSLDRPVRWASSNPDVATVDDRGMVTAVGPGEARITATSEGKTGEAAVTVRQSQTAPSLRVPEGQPTEFEGKSGDTFDLSVVVVDARGNAVAAVPVTWTADDGGAINGSKIYGETTGPDGRSKVVWTLSGKPDQVATASLPDGQIVRFRAEVNRGDDDDDDDD